MALITASDYNTLRSQIIEILGDGTPSFGVYGYGQTLSSSIVSQDATIGAAEWQLLINDVNVAYRHQTNTTIGYNAIQGQKILQDMRTAVGSALTTMRTNHDLAHPAQLETLTSQIIEYTKWGQDQSGITGIVNINFGNTTNSRYFFNQGGYYYLQGFYTGDPPTNNEINWKNALTAAAYTIDRSAYTTIVANGSSYTQLYYNAFAGPNWIEISANTTDSGNSINVKFVLEDNKLYVPGSFSYFHYHHGVDYGYGWIGGDPDSVTRPVGFNIIRTSATGAFVGIRPTTTIVQEFQ